MVERRFDMMHFGFNAGALKMREAGTISEVVALSIGPKQSLDTIRTALAMGADWGIHVTTDVPTD
jgi:electron transfer flavoprotein beta subunit